MFTLTRTCRILLVGALTVACCIRIPAATTNSAELVYLDNQGVVRWQTNHHEVALFGANYCLPSASDYRAAGYVKADRKKLAEADFAHFARMGWDGVRLCLWGDWENCDRQGNLIVNDHLDLMDYCIAQAHKRGVYILFTPITTYSAWWPDAKSSDPYPGFSKYFERWQLGVDPQAIAAQSNYVHQIMDHVNPYTGVALKDDPQILFVEMINEPVHQSDDLPKSIAYINTLADAVRSTGCRKILFHNVSQDFRITPAIRASRAQGVSFAWYPTGLNHHRALTENYLRSVEDYPPMLRPDLLHVPKVVYEFDSADMDTGYMYPAMARAFRGAGAQFVGMFSYDMLDTAPYNLGWQTHFLNLVYSPRKAMSAIIAAEVTRKIPRYSHYGDYPQNCRFGPFRVSYEEDTSELLSDEQFLHANNTQSIPPNPALLKRIAGIGSSPLVDYEGCGIYFLDKIRDGLWRLELYPDAILVQDPFAQKLNYTTVSSRIISRSWPMTIRLPDLGESFYVHPMSSQDTSSPRAKAGNISSAPGLFLLSREVTPSSINQSPSTINSPVRGLGLNEYICPAPPDLPPQLLPRLPLELPQGAPLLAAADLISKDLPDYITLTTVRDAITNTFTLSRKRGYRYESLIPATSLPAGTYSCSFTAYGSNVSVHHPSGKGQTLQLRVVDPAAPLPLLNPDQDVPRLVFTRIGDGGRTGVFEHLKSEDSSSSTSTSTSGSASVSASGPASTSGSRVRLYFPASRDRTITDYTMSLGIRDRIKGRSSALTNSNALLFHARANSEGLPVWITMVEADGTSWSKRLQLSTNWQSSSIPLHEFQLARGVKLPQGFPERWNYWLAPAQGRGAPGDQLQLDSVEHIQISLRPGRSTAAPDPWIELKTLHLTPAKN